VSGELHRRFLLQRLQRRLEREGVELPEEDIAASVWLEPVETSAAGVRYQVRLRRADVNIELNANTADVQSWALPKLADGPGPEPDDATALARAQAAAQLPAGAVLATSEWDEVAGRRVFIAHWEHREGGILVERDHVQVLVSGESGRVYAVYRRWHAIDFQATIR
jgi:hypothetical protein